MSRAQLDQASRFSAGRSSVRIASGLVVHFFMDVHAEAFSRSQRGMTLIKVMHFSFFIPFDGLTLTPVNVRSDSPKTYPS